MCVPGVAFRPAVRALSNLRARQGELLARIAWRGIFPEIHAGQGALRSESVLFRPFHGGVVRIGNVPERPRPVVQGEECFDQVDAALGRCRHDGTDIKRRRAGA